MQIGVLKEIKAYENRVGMVPASVKELVSRGHNVIVQQGAGLGIGVSDQAYKDVGAAIVNAAKDIFSESDLIVKVKEPLKEECVMLRSGQTIFAFLHLAAEPALSELLINTGVIGIAYETVTDASGHLPLLAPMSEIAGKISVQLGAGCLEKVNGGKGILLSGVPGVESGNVVVIGGGCAGSNAIRVALGMGANVTVLDNSIPRLRQLDDQFSGHINTRFSNHDALYECITQADLVIGAVLVPGAAAPKVISKDLISRMEPGSVIVDIAIDQGGCTEMSRPTTYDAPTFIENNVIISCVTNLPGGVPRTSTYALNNATLPFILELAEKGTKKALQENLHLRNGLNVYEGKVTHPAVAKALNKEYVPAEQLLENC